MRGEREGRRGVELRVKDKGGGKGEREGRRGSGWWGGRKEEGVGKEGTGEKGEE